MSKNCEHQVSIDFGETKIPSMYSMFRHTPDDYGYYYGDAWRYVEVIDLSNLDTSNVTDVGGAFFKCENLKKIYLINNDFSKVSNWNNMFGSCTSLIEVWMGGPISNVSISSRMFSYIYTNGTFYYNSAYDYSKIIAQLPSTWTAVPCTLVDGVLVPNE